MDPKNPQSPESKEAGVVISASETISTPAPAAPVNNGATAPQTPAATPIVTQPAKLTFMGKVAKFGSEPITRKDVAIAAGIVGVVVVGLEVTHRYVPKCPAVFGILEKKNPAGPKKQ